MRIRKSERGRMITRQAGRMLTVLATAVILVWCDPIVSRAAVTGTVLPKSVNIRKQPEQGSEQISSSSAGKEITILGKVEASGTTWYQVYVDANTVGYVRADMVEVGEGDIPTVSAEVSAPDTSTSDTGTDADSSQTDNVDVASIGSGTGAQVQAQEEMALQYATTNITARVRPDPSTSGNPVESLAPDKQVVVSGKSEGSDGKTWYFVNFTGANGSEKTGYIRSDLLDLGDLLPVEENTEPEPDVEAEEPESAPRNDYELKIETNSEGEEIWYLYNNIVGDQKEVELLWNAAGSQSVDDEDETDAIVKQRIVIVVLAVLLVALVVTVIIMAFKLRDAYYEDYEDDEDDEDEEEEQTSGRGAVNKERAERRRTSGGEEEKTSRRRESAETPRRERRESAETSRRERPERAKREREVTYREEPETESVKPAAKRKTKNFLLDDDEFEFEFLNMDDKDLK